MSDGEQHVMTGKTEKEARGAGGCWNVRSTDIRSYAATPDYFPIDAWDGTDFSVWGDDLIANDGPWRPGIHMPRWPSLPSLTVAKGGRLSRLRAVRQSSVTSLSLRIGCIKILYCCIIGAIEA